MERASSSSGSPGSPGTPENDMAKRGMLPKFRPAQLGAETLARPSIRPVKPSPPPPPPSPPRKTTSGFGPRQNREREIASDHPLAHDAQEHDELEASTANGVNAHGEPSTLNRGPRTIAGEIAREIVQASPRGGRVDAISFDDETQARRVDTSLLDKMRRDALIAAAPVHVAPARPAHLGVDYESLPSLEVRPPFDSYEAAFEEHDPVTQLGRAHESAQMARARREEPSYRETSYQEPSYQEREPAYQEREPAYREASYEPPPSSYDARERESSYEDSRARAPGSYYPGAVPSFPASALGDGGDRGDRAQNDQEPWQRREESGPRERPQAPPASPSYNDVNDSAQWSRDQGAQPVAGWSSLPAVNKTAQGIGPSQQHLIERERERIEAAMSPQIPPAPRVPNEMHPAFVVGVQPLRNPTPAPGAHALPSPQQAIHSSMPAQYGQPHARQAYPTPAPAYQAQPQQAQHHYQPPQQQPAYHAPPQQHYSSHPPHAQMIPRQHVPTPGPYGVQSSMNSAHVGVGAQLTQAPAATPKIGRFAWFVAGAAFGITFAFFATGFFSAGTKPADFPAPAQLPTVAAAAPAATAPTAPTAPAALAPTAPTALAPVAPAVAPAVAPIAPVAPAAPSAVAPSAPAPAAAAPASRPSTRRAPPPPRRPSAPTSQAPKNLGGGGPGADDERPAPAAPSGGGADISDLLGAGLKP